MPAKSEYTSSYGALGQIAWRSHVARDYFAGKDGAARWAEAREGRWPDYLGKPVLAPAAAEIELLNAISDGRLSSRRKQGN